MDQAEDRARGMIYLATKEKARVRAITTLGKELNVQQWIVEEAIADGTPVDTFRTWCCGSKPMDAGTGSASYL